MKRIKVDRLRRFVVTILQAAGVPEEEGRILAAEWVHADLTGYPSHGVAKLADSLSRLEQGIIEPKTRWEVVRDSGTVAVIDANNGWGPVASQKAIELANEKCKEFGSAWVAVRNSNHHGRTGYWTVQMAKAGVTGLAMTNTSAVMTPYGAKEPTLGTNPISIAIPSDEEYPLVLDMASSTQARGKIVLAKKKGESIPDDWAIDSLGRPTTDPNEALMGSLLPMAGHKGSGLAMMIDILSGVLTGSLFGGQIPRFYDDPLPQRIGHLFGAIDIDRFMPRKTFFDRLTQKKQETRESQPIDGVDRVSMPGDLEAATYQKNRVQGVPIEDEIVTELKKLAEQYGVTESLELITD